MSHDIFHGSASDRTHFLNLYTNQMGYQTQMSEQKTYQE